MGRFFQWEDTGMVTALGVSVGLTAAAIMSKGTPAQQERYARHLILDEFGGEGQERLLAASVHVR